MAARLHSAKVKHDWNNLMPDWGKLGHVHGHGHG